MARLDIRKKRTVETISERIGKIIIFCEGYTEYNYLKYFADIVNKSRNVDIEFGHNPAIEFELNLENVKGNAQTVLNQANTFFENEHNKKRFCYHEKGLVFDCDDPENIQEVINNMMDCENPYELYLTNDNFDIWLLMHLEVVTECFPNKTSLHKKLEEHLNVLDYKKIKNAPGKIRELLEYQKGINLENAIKNAKVLEEKMKMQNKDIKRDIKNMKPFTTMHHIMEKILEMLPKENTN